MFTYISVNMKGTTLHYYSAALFLMDQYYLAVSKQGLCLAGVLSIYLTESIFQPDREGTQKKLTGWSAEMMQKL